MKRYKGVLLDVDNTLLDFDAGEKAGVTAVLGAFGVRADAGMLEQYSRINASLWKAYERGEIEHRTIMETRFLRFFQELGLGEGGDLAERLYRAQLDASAIPVEGAGELLAWLYERYPLYVVTNGTSRTQYRRLAKAGFRRYFREVFVSEDAGCQKPRKEFFDYCFSRIRQENHAGEADPADYLIVGDSLTSDILGGINGGLDTCWFNRKGEPRPADIVPCYEIHRLEELRGLLGEAAQGQREASAGGCCTGAAQETGL